MSEQETLAVEKPEAEAVRPSLLGVFRSYKGRLLFTYALFNIENMVRLAQPWALGLAISDLLRSSYVGLTVFAGQHLLYLGLSAWRRMYDTRAFTGIYTDLAERLVVEQRKQGVEVSTVAARSALSRQMVDFFERDVPFLVEAVYSVVGTLVMLALCDVVLVPICLALLVPTCFISVWSLRRTRVYNRSLHDQLEREVEVIGRNDRREVRGHYDLL